MELVDFADEEPEMEVVDTRGKTGQEVKALQKASEVKYTVDYQRFKERKTTL